MSLREEWATIEVLVSRDLRRFFRMKSRIAGALMQPLLFWVILGAGLSQSFRLEAIGGPEVAGITYAQYFFPGVIAMMILFTALFATMSLIEDRNAGFLQAVLVAPSSRKAVVLGKVLGGTLVALVQVSLFLLLSPLAGFSFASIHWPQIFLALFLTGFGLNALGFFLAWWLNSLQGYHAIMSVLLIPLWLLSGAMFPIKGSSGWLSLIMAINPISYSVAAIRHAFYGDHLPEVLNLPIGSFWSQIFFVFAFAAFMLYLAVRKCQKSQII